MDTNYNIIVVDVETTGVTKADKVTEIGAIRYNLNGKYINHFERLANPGCDIPQKITEITGITTDMIKNEKTTEEVLLEFWDWVGTSNIFFVAHNAKFDMKMIFGNYLSNKDFSRFKVIDTLEWARKYKITRDNKLTTLKEYLNIKDDANGSHRALFDSKVCSQVFSFFIKEFIKPKNTEEAVHIFLERSKPLVEYIKNNG